MYPASTGSKCLEERKAQAFEEVTFKGLMASFSAVVIGSYRNNIFLCMLVTKVQSMFLLSYSKNI